ncbi:MAG: FHA domain-containing protein [Actinomycetota bacterium]
MITLTLLHPTQSIPVQSWSFESESVIRIGRANDNDVIIYSAVVSRHHVELWQNSTGWEIINFGANGTYIDDKPITQGSVVDGMIIRLGNSGPKIRVRMGIVSPKGRIKTGSTNSSLVSQTNDTSQEKTTLIIPTSEISKDETIIRFNDEVETQAEFD